MSSQAPRPLHKEERLSQRDHSDTFTMEVESAVAEALIAEMIARVSGLNPNKKNMEFPPHEESTGTRIVEFRPQVLRLDLEGQAVTCFGWYLTDEGRLLYQVRFPATRTAGQPVQFEITDFFNHENPARIPMLF